MFSARTGLAVGKFYMAAFTCHVPDSGTRIWSEELYEFLVRRNREFWLCDAARECSAYHACIRDICIALVRGDRRGIPGDVATRQQALKTLAEDILNADKSAYGPFCQIPHYRERQQLIAALELDGYVFRDGRILPSEGEAQEVEQERGELEQLYESLGLPSVDVVKNHLQLCNEHYETGGDKASDCIHNARQYLERILEDVAVTWSQRPGSAVLPKPATDMRAVHYRDYLRDVGLLSAKEHEAFSKLYGLLSETGGHPGIPRQHQARVFRRLALSMALFTLLSLESKIGDRR
jgi:hypothetical protein